MCVGECCHPTALHPQRPTCRFGERLRIAEGPAPPLCGAAPAQAGHHFLSAASGFLSPALSAPHPKPPRLKDSRGEPCLATSPPSTAQPGPSPRPFSQGHVSIFPTGRVSPRCAVTPVPCTVQPPTRDPPTHAASLTHSLRSRTTLEDGKRRQQHRPLLPQIARNRSPTGHLPPRMRTAGARAHRSRESRGQPAGNRTNPPQNRPSSCAAGPRR